MLTRDECRTKLVTALRSGDYVQAKMALRHFHAPESKRPTNYCCLGVACDVVNPNGWVGTTSDFLFEDQRADVCLPRKLTELYGFIDDAGRINKSKLSEELKAKILKEYEPRHPLSSGFPSSLLDANDCGVTFPTIADIIESGACYAE